jgi:hypothetical protein
MLTIRSRPALWVKTFLLLASATLASCGGGDGSSSSSAPAATAASASGEVPASAYRSIDAFIGYLREMPPSDSSVPLDARKSSPPVSETDLPMPL